MLKSKKFIMITVLAIMMIFAGVTSAFASEMYEPNNNSANAYTILPFSGFPYTAQLSTSADVDWYKFTATDSGFLTLNLTPPAGKNYDFDVIRSGSSIAAAHSAGSGAVESATFPVTQGYEYYVVIGSDVGDYSNTADYTLVKDFFGQSYIPAYEPNNSNYSAAAVDLNNTNVYAAIDSDSDVDWFKFTANNTGSATIHLIPPFGKNYDIFVLDRANGATLGEGHLTGGAVENVTISATSGHEYTVIVYGASSSDYSSNIPYALFKT